MNCGGCNEPLPPAIDAALRCRVRVEEHLSLANSHSSGDRRLEQPSAMLPPSVAIKRGTGRTRYTSLFLRRAPGERLMNATAVVIEAECLQLSLQIERVPEERAIEKLAAKGADQTFRKRMRKRHMRNRLDLVDFEYAQVGEPAMKAKRAPHPEFRSGSRAPAHFSSWAQRLRYRWVLTCATGGSPAMIIRSSNKIISAASFGKADY